MKTDPKFGKPGQQAYTSEAQNPANVATLMLSLTDLSAGPGGVAAATAAVMLPAAGGPDRQGRQRQQTVGGRGGAAGKGTESALHAA